MTPIQRPTRATTEGRAYLPTTFGTVIDELITFADPALLTQVETRNWDPEAQQWQPSIQQS